MTLQDALKKYVDLNVWIREKSAPRLSEAENAEEYRALLIRNFSRIGEISVLSLQIMTHTFEPVLLSDNSLSFDEREALYSMADDLLNAASNENLDIPLRYLIAMRLYEDASRKNDLSELIRALDGFVMASCTLQTMTRRLLPYCDSAIVCRNKALDAADRILEYLPKERFAELPDDASKEAVLINSRYKMVLYEYPVTETDEATRTSMLHALEQSLALSSDPFYRDLLPGYNWQNHEFRALQYLANLTSYHNVHHYDPASLKTINGYAARALASLHRDAASLSVDVADEFQRLALLRCGYLAGETDVETYRAQLKELMADADPDSTTYESTLLHAAVPLEYILTLDKHNLDDGQKTTVTGFYRDILRYVNRMPSRGHITYLLTLLSDLLKNFIEIEGGISFEQMGLELMAAIHPPTYIHSLSVADLSCCLAKHLFQKHPELFAHTPGYPDYSAIEHYLWHAAACHDFGKLFIVETIKVYGRSLYNREYDWIHSHPDAGAGLLERYESTKRYADVARGHHRWYNGRGGYPESYIPEKTKDRLSVDLVLCADCMDASTDRVGRSYKQSKTLDEFIEELHEGSGTQYAPFLTELLEDPAVCDELSEILEAGRISKYDDTYHVLDQ